MSFVKQDVEFLSEGIICRGWLFKPNNVGTDSLPAIVMAHGFSAVKEMYLDKYAEEFASAGFVVLVFDYRFNGASDGEPRQHIIPHEQHVDYQNAITWVSQQEQVDASRIGIWGSSYSGGHVLHLAAIDRRVKAVVAQVPLVHGWRNAQRLMRGDIMNGFIETLHQYRAARYNGAAVQYLPVVGPQGEASALPTQDSYDWFTQTGELRAPNWRNEITLETMEAFLGYNPSANIDIITPTPLLMIVAERDELTPTDLAVEAFEKARHPKQLEIIPGGHFDAYTNGFSTSSSLALDWFKKHLLSKESIKDSVV